MKKWVREKTIRPPQELLLTQLVLDELKIVIK